MTLISILSQKFYKDLIKLHIQKQKTAKGCPQRKTVATLPFTFYITL